MESLTFTFRTKRSEFADARVLDGTLSDADLMREGYRRPQLGPSHIVTPRNQWGTRATLMFGGASPRYHTEACIRSVLDAVGLEPWCIFSDDENRELKHGASVSIRPRGNGFMADVTLSIPLHIPGATL